MKTHLKHALLALGCLIILLTGLTGLKNPEEPLQKIVSVLEKFRAVMPQEKVYLHFDKPFYATGDSIWLKAYLVNAERNELSLLSKIIYADLLDSRDSVVASIRLPASVGLTRGYFKTDPGLHPGVYRIRAYTRWMRNFDPASFIQVMEQEPTEPFYRV